MHDYLGRPIDIGDYVFGGGSKPGIWQVIKEDSEGLEYYGRITKLGDRVDIRAYLCDYIKLTKEELMLYLLNQGYKDTNKKDMGQN
jgi:hypothetical protein